MRLRLIVAAVVLAISPFGCGHTQAPDSETEAVQLQEQRSVQLRQMRRHRELEAYEREMTEKRQNRHLAQQKEYDQERPGCEAAVDDPSTTDERRHKCAEWLAEEKQDRRSMWQVSGVVCFDHRMSDRLVEVSCDIPYPVDGTSRFQVAFEKSQQLATYAALSSGMTDTLVVGKDKIKATISTSTTPVECKTEGSGSFALRSFAWAFLAGNAIKADCSHPGGTAACIMDLTQPPPSPQVDCYGGESVASVTSLHMTTQYETLTADEAKARDNLLLPRDRRPLAAMPIAKLFEGL